MNLATLAVKNVGRHKGRTVLTAIAIAIAILLFVILRTVVASWTAGVEHGAKDRIGTRHKVTFIMTLPLKYVEDIRNFPGVAQATWANWFGAKDPNKPEMFFANLAVDPDTFFEVYNDLTIDPAQLEAWKSNRQGAIIGSALAKMSGWEVGERVTLQGSIYPGDWQFDIVGIYDSESRAADRSMFLFHWDYLNETLSGPQKDQVGWIASRVADAGSSAELSKKIDAMFEERDVQTLTMSERAMQQSFLGMFSTILFALDVISVAILFIVLAILGNTIAMAVRERTTEYGCLRAIGFRSGHIATFVVGESLTVGVLGAGLGLALAHLLINGALSRFIEENLGNMFPYFRVTTGITLMAIGVGVLLALIAAAIPAYQAARLNVIDALRKVD